MNDLRFALRQFIKNPGFTLVAVLTLAIGIGATTAIASLVKIAVFDPVPGGKPDRLLEMGHIHEGSGWYAQVSPAAWRDACLQTNLFSRVVAYHWDGLTLPGEDFPEPVRGSWVTPEFFGLWNVQPLLGRAFAADEGHPENNAVLVISHRFWQKRFGGDPAIIGRTIHFRERPMTVVGVMPAHFSFPASENDYWRPVDAPDPAEWGEHSPQIWVIAERRPDAGTSEVQAFLDVLTARHVREIGRLGGRFEYRFQARDLRELFTTTEVRRTLNLLLGAIVFVLLIAAANVANLQLARLESRRQELALRTALGAGSGRVFRQLLTESLLLALLGGGAGLVVAVIGLELLEGLLPANLPRLKPITLDADVLSIACGITLTTGLLFGLAPALSGRRSNLSDVLKLGAATTTRDRRGGICNQALIAGQLALVLVLLTGAGLMARSVIALMRVNPGLDPKHVVRVYPTLHEIQRGGFHPDPALNNVAGAAFTFFANARERVAAIPGVISVGVGFEGRETEVAPQPGAPFVRLKKYWIGVEADDPLRVMRVPLKQGRWLDRGDAGQGVGSVVINETAARQLWPGEAALGKKFSAKERGQTDVAYEVVGVVGDTRDYSKHAAPQPMFYRALQKEGTVDISAKFLVIRTATDPVRLYKPIGQALKDAGADLVMPEFINLHDVLERRTAGHRALTLCLTLFGGVGSILAAIGLYGMLAYGVARRTREIGIRMAIGAQKSDVMRLILSRGLLLASLGLGLGLIAALATGRVLRAYLFGIHSTDPATLLLAASLLGSVALFACWLPARRATKVDPMEALRSE